MRQIFPVAGPGMDVIPAVTAGELPDAVGQLAALYRNGQRDTTADQAWLRANMITSTDGAANLDGRSGALGSPADRMVFWVLRSLADVILVGAGTARAEHYRPVRARDVWAGLRTPGQPAAPALAVLSSRLDLGGTRLLEGDPSDARTILLTTAAAKAGDVAAVSGRAQVIVAGDRTVDARAAISALTGLGYHRILAEGGPRLLGELTQAGLLDELCLTISPVLAGGAAGRIVTSGTSIATRLSLAHVLADGDYLFARYTRGRPPLPDAGRP